MSLCCNCILSKRLVRRAPPKSRLDRFLHQTTLLLPFSVSRAIGGLQGFFKSRTFVVLIYCEFTTDQDDTLHMEAPACDLDLVTQFLITTNTIADCDVYVVTDFEVPKQESKFKYKVVDDSNARNEILQTIAEASKDHNSGVILYGGHGQRNEHGVYLLPRHDNHIYAADIAMRLPRHSTSTIACIIDACYTGTFFDPMTVPCVVRLENGVVVQSTNSGLQTGSQLIVISAARENQRARAVSLEPEARCSHGVLLGCLMDHVHHCRNKGIDPLELVKDLEAACPPPTAEDQTPVAQEPFIASSRPISSKDFRKLHFFN